jgi:AcrR family transcriptional regulator
MPRQETVRQQRRPLSRERLLETAVELADNNGIESLSMRKLGDAVGVEAMSLYNHVANKEDLLDGMVDIVFSEIDLPADGSVWKSAMRRRAVSAREVLARHRWAISLVESRGTPGPATLRHHDAALGSLRAAGFSIEMAGHAYALLDSYILGFALQEASHPFGKGDEKVKLATDFLRAVPAGEYPHITEFLVQRYLQADYDYGDEFEFGLDLILECLDRTR